MSKVCIVSTLAMVFQSQSNPFTINICFLKTKTKNKEKNKKEKEFILQYTKVQSKHSLCKRGIEHYQWDQSKTEPNRGKHGVQAGSIATQERIIHRIFGKWDVCCTKLVSFTWRIGTTQLSWCVLTLMARPRWDCCCAFLHRPWGTHDDQDIDDHMINILIRRTMCIFSDAKTKWRMQNLGFTLSAPCMGSYVLIITWN